MEIIKTINFPEKTFNNKDLLKKRVNRKKNYRSNDKEIKIEKSILSIGINYDSIA